MMAADESGAAKVTLPAETQILITRTFDAPAAHVFRAWTEPELVRRWWPARRGEMTACEIDLRVGGRWRFAMVTPSGIEVAFHGSYHEIEPVQKLVWSEVYETMPGEEAINTLTLTQSEGFTSIELLVEHETKQARDFHIASGMEDGLQDALSDLELVASSLRA
jgi:uncharacterized protein YndB with AHSA1/START domain